DDDGRPARRRDGASRGRSSHRLDRRGKAVQRRRQDAAGPQRARIDGAGAKKSALAEQGRNALEFLVEMQVGWPPDGDPEQKKMLIEGEHKRAVELAKAGILKRLWRVPGRWANFGLWEAPDATELHKAISSLPFYPWLDVKVHPLAKHPND